MKVLLAFTNKLKLEGIIDKDINILDNFNNENPFTFINDNEISVKDEIPDNLNSYHTILCFDYLENVDKYTELFQKMNDDTIYLIYHTHQSNQVNLLIKNNEKNDKIKKKENRHESGSNYEIIANMFFQLKGNRHVIANQIIKSFGDTTLEAKLELLHSLLVPPEEIDITFTIWEDLNLKAGYIENSLELKAWIKFVENVKANVKEYHKSPFDEVYLNELSILRDELLNE